MGYNAVRIVAMPIARLSLSVFPAGCYTLCVAALTQGATMFIRLGAPECLIILVLLIIVSGLAFRGGFFRGRRRK